MEARAPSGGRLFDRWIVVDWSARSRPATGVDSVWIGVADGDFDRPAVASNPSTRAEAIEIVGEMVGASGSSLLAIDASLGLPAGTAEALGAATDADDGRAVGDGTPRRRAWERLWGELADTIDDRPDNANNRFDVAAEWNRRISAGPGPFWGCPPSKAAPTLTTTKPSTTGVVLPEWRTVERLLRERGQRPFSSWQLLGAGSVGSQSLLAIAAVERMRRNVADVRVDVWPFTTGLGVAGLRGGPDDDNRSGLVVAECWPSLFVGPSDPDDDRVRDEVQVIATVETLRTADRAGELSSWFEPAAAHDLVPGVLGGEDTIVGEEGWILGVR